ncbi:hypothetical protein OSTOST_04980, partial [Ostertagia ostertagi]
PHSFRHESSFPTRRHYCRAWLFLKFKYIELQFRCEQWKVYEMQTQLPAFVELVLLTRTTLLRRSSSIKLTIS